MPYASGEGACRIWYEEGGRGEPLLLIHGAGAGIEFWDELRATFESRHRVIVYDQRGIGKSDAPDQPPYSVEMFAADAVAVLDAVDIRRAHVYGISLGGRIAQRLAIDHRDRVGAVVLGATSVGKHLPIDPSVGAQIRGTGDPAQRTKFLIDSLFTPAYQAAQPEVIQSFMTRLMTPKPPHVIRYTMDASDNYDGWDGLPSITAPVLVIHGTDDHVNPTANARLLVERIPRAELHLVEGGRHGYAHEFHPQTTEVVLDFLARHPLMEAVNEEMPEAE